MSAINRAKQATAPYTTKNNESILSVKIVLYKGDHYILNEAIVAHLDSVDFYSMNYHLKISPYYCSMMGEPDTSICFNQTSNSDSVNVHNKIGIRFHIDVPEILTIENIKFEMMDSLILPENDPDNCLNQRKK
jgi:hypothetical protein